MTKRSEGRPKGATRAEKGNGVALPDKIEINVQGHIEPLFFGPYESHCGGEVGFSFWFGNEGGWVIPYDDIDKIKTIADRVRLAMKSKPGGGVGK